MAATCDQAVKEVFEKEEGVLTTNQVIERIYDHYPDKPWKSNTIYHNLNGMSVNHPSRKHHPSLWKYELLFYLGNSRYRRYNPTQDGTWEVSEQGVRPKDSTEETEVSEEIEVGAVETSLTLERDLEKSLLSNLGQLEPNLQLYQDKGITGQQLDTGTVGRLDLLGVDRNGDFVVIELKTGEANDRVCGQILRYIGWVKENLAGNRKVRGFIVANEFSELLKYAAKAMPDVTLKKYEVRFEFKDI